MAIQTAELFHLQELDSRVDALARARAALDDGAGLKEELDAAEAAIRS